MSEWLNDKLTLVANGILTGFGLVIGVILAAMLINWIGIL